MNDITILQEMLSTGAQVPLQQTHGKPSVTLKDKQGKTTVEIINLPDNSIVIKPEYFKPPNAFKGSKGERRRADFAIVSNKDAKSGLSVLKLKKEPVKTRKILNNN